MRIEISKQQMLDAFHQSGFDQERMVCIQDAWESAPWEQAVTELFELHQGTGLPLPHILTILCCMFLDAGIQIGIEHGRSNQGSGYTTGI